MDNDWYRRTYYIHIVIVVVSWYNTRIAELDIDSLIQYIVMNMISMIKCVTVP